jgi:hypothetical protein
MEILYLLTILLLYVRFEHPGHTYRGFGFIFSEPGCDNNPLLAALFYLFYSLACFQPADHHIENESPENFQDINFEDLEHQQAGFKGKCPWCLLYLFPISIYRLHACIHVWVVGITMCHIFPCNILVILVLGRMLVIFTSCIACQVWG